MNRKYICLFILALGSLASVSCGPSGLPPLYPVEGKVIYKGQPAVGATVMFQREDAPAATTGDSIPIVPVGLVDDEGKFTLECDPGGRGAPAGKYRVLIQWRSRDTSKIETAASSSASAPASTTSASASKKKGRAKIVPDKPDGAPDLLGNRFMKADSARFHVEVKPESNTLEPFDVSS